MKTKRILKMGLGLLLIGFLGLISFKTFAHKKADDVLKTEQFKEHFKSVENGTNELYTDDNVSITIDSNTSEKDFEDIKTMLAEHQITATFSNVERNAEKKLIGLKIVLKDANGNQAVSQMSSNLPIAQIVFGRKDGALYITQSNKENGAFAFFNRPNMMPFSFDNDSINGQPFAGLGNFNFNDFFNDEDGSFFLNGKTMNLDELREQMEKQFESAQNGSPSFSGFFNSDDTSGTSHKFRFIDDPNSNKIIIIDGKDSDFKTLNDLANRDELEAVDVLKPETAVSVYGKKAKDGAIIATSKGKHQ